MGMEGGLEGLDSTFMWLRVRVGDAWAVTGRSCLRCMSECSRVVTLSSMRFERQSCFYNHLERWENGVLLIGL